MFWVVVTNVKVLDLTVVFVGGVLECSLNLG